MSKESTVAEYRAPSPSDFPAKSLIEEGGGGASYQFYERIEIGRYHENRRRTGALLVRDPTVSSRHCVISQEPDGTCFVRDVSRNGTRVDGRRLSPNSKTELKVGQILSVGQHLKLRLDGEGVVSLNQDEITGTQTVSLSNTTIVTILVGDIRNFTTLVQKAPTAVLQESVVLAFRLEKLADGSTGPIVTCRDTRLMAAESFEFRDLGSRRAKGFDAPQQVYALIKER